MLRASKRLLDIGYRLACLGTDSIGQLGEFRRALHDLLLSSFDLGSRGAPAEIAHSLGAQDITQAQRAEPDQHSWLPNVVELPPCRGRKQ